MNRQVFYSDKAARPKGPYSQAIIHNGILYVSGQVPVDPAKGSIVQGGIEEQARTALNNLKTTIEEAGFAMEGVLKVTCYLANMDDFETFNRVYSEYFGNAPPARTTIQASKLPMDVKLEVDATVGRINSE